MKSINQNDYLTVGGVYDFPRHALLHTAAGKNGCCVEISSKERTDITYIDKRQEGMLVLSPCKLKIESGDIQISTLDFTRLAKLQVFIDKAQQRKKRLAMMFFGDTYLHRWDIILLVEISNTGLLISQSSMKII